MNSYVIIKNLPPGQRDVCDMAAQGLGYHEMAARRGISIGGVNIRLRRAKAKLGCTSTTQLVAVMAVYHERVRLAVTIKELYGETRGALLADRLGLLK